MIRGGITAAIFGLLWVPAALGAGTAPGYSGVGGAVQGGIQSPPKTHGGLPFTGLDLSLMVIGALLLLLVGASMRRLARRRA